MTPRDNTTAVTGGSGLIGSELVRALAAKGHALRLLSRHPAASLPAGITCVQGDIRSVEAVRQLVRGCSRVVHLAGISHTSLRSQAEISEAEQINAGGVANLMEQCIAVGVERVVLASSALVYAGGQGIDLDEQSATDDDSVYARTKLQAEDISLQASQSGRIQVVIVRPCLTYGPGVRFNLAAMMRAIHRHYYFHLRGINPKRSFLSVSNAAAAISHLLDSGESGKTYNLSDREPLSLVDFANSLADDMSVARPLTLPVSLIHAATTVTFPLHQLGLPMPVTRESLRKLTHSFTLDVGALEKSGFCWLDDGQETRKKMVETYLGAIGVRD